MCVKPLVMKRVLQAMSGKDKYTQQVPCGKCPECVKAKQLAWSFRIDMELKRSLNPLFVTLTYSTENLSFISEDTGTLVKRDLQLFFKRLRKHHEKLYPQSQKIKYYAVGEYGKGATKRPHYHIVLLNCLDATLVHPNWGLGHSLSLPYRTGATPYVLKYLSKPKTRSKQSSNLPEFSLSSKHLGDNYLTPQMIKWHNQDPKFTYVETSEGFKMAMPKYFKEKIFNEEQRKKVTDYLQTRVEQGLIDQINKYKQRFPNMDDNFYQNLVEQKKNLLKFEKRKNEVL